MSSGVILLQWPYISFSSPLLLILGREIIAAAVALFFMKIQAVTFGPPRSFRIYIILTLSHSLTIPGGQCIPNPWITVTARARNSSAAKRTDNPLCKMGKVVPRMCEFLCVHLYLRIW